MKSGIYKIECSSNGKVYVGSSINVGRRIIDHKCNLKRGSHHNRMLQNAYNKYGCESFSYSIIEACDEDERIEREKYWIDTISSSFPNGFNLVIDPVLTKHSDETRKKMSESHKGKKHSEEHRLNVSKAKSGVPVSDETREKIRESMKLYYEENGTISGRTHSNETKKKMSDAKKGRKLSEEHKENLRKAKADRPNKKIFGRKPSEETKRKMSEAHKGRKHSDESKKKMSEAKKGRKKNSEEDGVSQ